MDIEGNAKGDQFGNAVSISADGTTFVVGAPYHDGNETRYFEYDSGLVRVYKYNSTIGSYAQVGLDITGAKHNDFFGWSLSISGDGTTFVAGAPRTPRFKHGYGCYTYFTGPVRVYKYSSNIDSYVQVGLDIYGDLENGYGTDQFGFSVSIAADGNTFVVGAPKGGFYRGSVRVYKYNSTVNSYVQHGLDIVGEFEQDAFGFSVSMSADGSTFVVGARFNNERSGQDSIMRTTTINMEDM